MDNFYQFPDHQENFVGDKIIQRFLEIEHYFDDATLNQFKLKGDKVAPDSSVFNIRSHNKTSFAEDGINNLVNSSFGNFSILFDKLNEAGTEFVRKIHNIYTLYQGVSVFEMGEDEIK